jgi:oligopeptide/dipeptide ABC transporter ATP-binding protein
VVAVDRLSLNIEEGTTFGLVGESGSGKTTVGRAVLGLIRPASGRISVAGEPVRHLALRAAVAQGKKAQVVFQDPAGSLNPARLVLDTLREPLRIHGRLKREASTRAAEALGGQVSLAPGMLRRLPYQLSGGQNQRAAIARALAPGPRLVVCDEPVTALDVSTQAQVVNLLVDLQHRSGVAYLFISHDISVVRHVSHRIGVIYAGRLVEVGESSSVSDSPSHPYTQALLAAIPVPDPARQRERRAGRRSLLGTAADDALPADGGCSYRLRCPWADEVCQRVDPELQSVTEDHLVACHHAERVLLSRSVAPAATGPGSAADS